MNSLDSLVKLYKQCVDEALARVTALEMERAEVCARVDRLVAEFETERETARNSYEGNLVFPAYATRVAERQDTLAKKIAAFDAAIDEAREVVVLAYRELKKYEISRDLRAQRERMAEARREQAELDEIGSVHHRRNRAG